MARFKRPQPHMPVTLLSLTPEDRRAMERVASIMNVPLAQLQLLSSTPQAGQGKAPHGHLQGNPEKTQRVIDLDADDDSNVSPGTPDDGRPNDNDSRDSASEADAGPWHSSAAEFDGIDDDITREYENIAPWDEDFPILTPPGAPMQAPTPGSGMSTKAPASVAYGHQLQAAWDFPQAGGPYATYPSPSVMGSLSSSFGTDVPTPAFSGSAVFTPAQPQPQPQPHPQSWELVENPLTQHSQSSGWPMAENYGRPAQLHPKAGENALNDAIRFISVDPVQPQGLARPQRRGPFQDRERQEETSRTRGLKACVRCRMQKIRCSIVEDDPSGICGTCLTVSKQKVHYLPCLRHRLTECTLYRTGKAPGLEFSFRWTVMKLKDITEWESNNLRTIQVQSDVCEAPLKLLVRKFIPIPHKDSIHRSWVDYRTGVKKFKRTTPYAIVNMKNAVKDMREYVQANIFKCMDYFLRGSDQLVKETYEFARKHMQRVESDEERKLLGNFFRLWFAIRRTATTEHIVGDDTLDMEPETKDDSYPLFGKIPLPPVMIQQLDMILTLGILDPLRKQVLEDFQKLALATNPRNWMTIYLVTFMSLHSCAKITAENYHNARKHGLVRRYAIPNFISERHHSANVFLSHFHYRTESCNPFKQDWKRRHMTPFSYMSVDDIQFLERTKLLLKEREDVIKTNTENDLYEHELYFVSQMFQENWQPRDTTIDRTEGTINDVGLKRYAEDTGGKK